MKDYPFESRLSETQAVCRSSLREKTIRKARKKLAIVEFSENTWTTSDIALMSPRGKLDYEPPRDSSKITLFPMTMYTNSICNTCRHVHVVVSGKGSRFLRCGLAEQDKRFPKYPPQPVGQCVGFVEASKSGEQE